MCAFWVRSIRRDRHLVEPHQSALSRSVIRNFDAVFSFCCAVTCLKDVARPTEGHADFAVCQSVDVFRRVEFLDVRTNRHQHFFGFCERVSVFGVWVEARIGESSRNHFGRCVEEVNAALSQLFHVGWVEYQLEAVDRCVVAQKLSHFARVYADTSGAPHVVDRIGVAGVILRGAIFDHVPQVASVRQFRHVERLERASYDLTLKEGTCRHNNVVARTASQHFGLKNFVRVEHVVDQVIASFSLELFQERFVDVVRPVINAHLFCHRRASDERNCSRHRQPGFCHISFSRVGGPFGPFSPI